MSKEYPYDLQQLFLSCVLTHSDCFFRVQNLYNPENFDKQLRPVAKFIKTHVEDYSAIPKVEQIKAVTGIEVDIIPEFTSEYEEWFLDEFEGFTKRKELERAILKAADLLNTGDYGPVEKLIKDAVQIGLTKDLGTEYFGNPKERLNRIRDNNGQVSTGWRDLDAAFYGGVNRGELNIFAGPSGSGKSLFMQNMALNWTLAGFHGCYITLELSEELTCMRIDSMATGIQSNRIFKDIDKVDLSVRMISKNAGSLQVKWLPAQSNVNDIRAFLREFQVKYGIKPDFVMIDYLDLLMPVSVKVNPSDAFVKDKYVSEELRNLAKEKRMLMITASQLNRESIDESEYNHSHIAGGISKINTADNVIGIFTSRAMRERGAYQIQLMKTRSSNGVGQKIDLAYNVDTLKISDAEQTEPTGNAILSSLKRGPPRKESEAPAAENKSTGAVPHSEKLKQMLAGLNQ